MINIKRTADTLSEKERKFVQALLDGECLTGAMLEAGYSRSVACAHQARVRNRPRVRKALIAEYIKRGLFVTDEERALVEMSESVGGK